MLINIQHVECDKICPKDLFPLQRVKRRLWVDFKNEEFGEGKLGEFKVAHSPCVNWTLDAPDNLISIIHYFPVIHYSRDNKKQKPIQGCPKGAIVGNEYRSIKGNECKKVIRKRSRVMGVGNATVPSLPAQKGEKIKNVNSALQL